MDQPTEAAIADLVRAASAAPIPDATLQAVASADRPKTGPRAGELWRARRPDDGPVTLVWLRALTPSQATAVPASFDIELADETALIIPAERSPLGLPLALHVSIETTIERKALLDRLGTIDVDDAPAVDVPPNTVSPLDGRAQYRAVLEDAVGELAATGEPAPRSADGDAADWWPVGIGSDRADVLIAVHQALDASHPGARITPRAATSAAAEKAHAVAQVAELDAFVLVAVVDPGLDGPPLLEAARQVLHADQLLNAVCLVEGRDPFMSVIIDRRDVVAAIETPSGSLRPPRQSRSRTPIGDALAKFLDTTISPFGRLASTVVDAEPVDARSLAVDVSAEAVRAVEASARGYKVDGKRPGYERVTRHKASISRLVEEALNDNDVDVASILGDDE